MATIDEILAAMPDEGVTAAVTNEVLVIDPNTRQISIPSVELTFGVEGDAGSERKYFLCPRYVGDNVDLASCFIRVNYRNANGDMDEYLVNDVVVDGDNVVFSWELSGKAIKYKGQTRFVVCAIGPDTILAWHTTQATGLVLAGLEPDNSHVVEGTSDVVAQLIGMVNAQTAAVEAEGATQVQRVKTAAKAAETASVAEIEAKGVNTLASIPDDYTALSEAVTAIERGMAPGIVCEAAGETVVVSDASNQALCGLRIFGRSTQDGTPTPDAPVEIVSVDKPVVTVAGKNLAYANTTREVTYSGNTISTSVNESEVVLSGTATKLHSYGILRTRPLSVGSYTVSAYGLNVTNSSTDRIYVMNAETEKVLCNNIQDGNPKTFNITSDGTVVRIDLVFGEGSTYNNKIVRVQVEKGDIATEYEPYKVAQTIELTHTLPGIPVTSGGNYTDSDGQQWICDEVDLERGVYVQRVKVLALDGVNIAPYAATQDNGQPYAALYPKDIFNSSVVLSTHYSHPGVNWSDENGKMYCIGASIIINDSRFVNTQTAVNCLAEDVPTIMYRLSTPIETPLSETEIAAYRALHTNKPNTTILNDQGAHMAVAYTADTKLYIDNKIKEALQ